MSSGEAVGVGQVIEALRRLDRWIVRVCDAELARAQRLAPGESGWAAIRHAAGPSVSELHDGLEAPPLADGAFAGVRRLGLDDLDADILLILVAPWMEPRYRLLYAAINDDVGGGVATERTLTALLGRTPARHAEVLARVSSDAALVEAGLVVRGPEAPPLCRTVDLAEDVRQALLGAPTPRRIDGIGVVVRVGSEPRPGLEVAVGTGEWPPSPSAALRIVPEGPVAVTTLLEAWRTAALRGASLEVDTLALSSDDAAGIVAAAHRWTRAFGGAVRVRSRRATSIPVPQTDLPDADFLTSRALWEATGLPLPGAELDALAGWPLSAERIAEVPALAGSSDPARLHRVAARLCAVPVPHGRLVVPERTLEDLVVRASTRERLDRLVEFVRTRDRLGATGGFDRRFRLRVGPAVLFAGRSGTGKTMAAEGVAHALHRPLVAVDLSQLVSKYIGETEKNIDAILDAAERSGAVLFFDEGDALFGARTDVSSSNDRYANLEVGYLLQRIEQHRGLVVLATNLRHSIDEAFVRRMMYRIEFPLPDPPERAQIWDHLLGDELPRAADVDPADLGRRWRFSGGEIRNVALKALLAARGDRELGLVHVESAVTAELLELGRLSRLDGTSDRGTALRRAIEVLERRVDEGVRSRFLKEVHVVHGSPTREAMAGKRPAVSLSAWRVGLAGGGLRLGIVVSAWSQRPEEEHELLAVVHDALLGAGPSIRVQESYDFDLLHRFWSSHQQPVRPSIVVDVLAD